MYRRYGDIPWETGDAASGASSAGAPASASGIGTAPVGVAERPHVATARRGARRNGHGLHPLPAELLPAIRLHGVRLHAISEKKTIDHILDELDAGRGGVVVTPNLDHIRRARRDLSFGALVAEADLVVADGMPLVWASKLQGTPLPQRVAGSDLISTLSGAAARRGKSIFLLGGVPGAAEGAAKVLKQLNPQLNIVGTHCPPLGFENDEREMRAIMTALAAAAPDIVFVALGSPKQEFLIQRLRGDSVLPRAWWLGVGISFSFLCGDVQRAPRWVQKCGLEWVHRLVQDPKRLFYRYVVVGIPFGAAMMSRAALRGIPARLRRRDPMALPDVVLDATAPTNPIIRENGIGLMPATMPSAMPATALDQAISAAQPQPAVDAPPRPARRTNEPHTRSLNRLRAMILLGGQVRSSGSLSEACGRSILDLPLDADGSIFNHWLAGATDLARHAGVENLPVLVMVNRHTPEPVSAAQKYVGQYRVERDLSEYRGTGGVLRDLAANYDDDDLLLVCNAAQILLEPLPAIATALDRKQGDVTIVSHTDGTPSGVQLVAAKCLKMIPDAGFVDFKEQGLPLIATKYGVSVLHIRRPTALPVRDLPRYVQAMRQYHLRRGGRAATRDPLAEDWQPAFGVVEQGSLVDPRATVHDSIVLKGGVVEAGAVLVKSIVCPGGVVKKDKHVVEQLVCPEERA
jgi:N-acetylglucosaminyldiphosphoundecaprenol N-acetyl-beta-D-mannosaminyltransferase